MKKLLTLAMALAFTLPTFAGAGTDTFNRDVAGIPVGDFGSGTWTGSTGAEYSYTNLKNWMTTYFVSSENSLFTVAVPAEGCYIEKIYRESGLGGTYLNLYVSDAPITAANLASATLSGTISAESTYIVPGQYSYFAITAADGDAYADNLVFTWAEKGGDTPDPGPQPGGGGDHITSANLQAQNPTGNFSATGYQDRDALNKTLSYTGTSGAEYALTEVIANGTWWTLDWNYPYDKGTLQTTKSGGYIESVKIDFDYVPDSFQFYVSENEIDPSNLYATGVQSVNLNKGNYEWTADAPYRYFYCANAQERIIDLTINWAAEKPVFPCKKPDISCYGEYIPGADVIVYNNTPGSDLHVEVYVNSVLDNELSTVYTEGNYTFKLPGKAGDIVNVKAWSTKEGYTDSAVEEREFKVVLPSMGYLTMNPSNNLVPGMTVTLSSDVEGASIEYEWGVSRSMDITGTLGEDVIKNAMKTEPSPVTITIPEDGVTEGMVFWVNATGKCEGYRDTDPIAEKLTLGSNKLSVPTFNPEPEEGMEMVAGSTVTITRPEHATTLHYTVNGGQETVSQEYSVSLTVDQDLAIVAWASGDAPYKDSEKVTANYKLEVLGENVDAIVPACFTTEATVENYTTFPVYKSEKTGVEYRYDGAMRPSYDGVNCFYFDKMSDEDAYSILYSLTNPDGRKITRVRIDSPLSYSGAYIMFNQNEPVNAVTTEMMNFDGFDGARLRIKDDANGQFKFGQWIKLADLDYYDYGDAFKTVTDSKLMTVWRFGQNCYLSRILIEYEPKGGDVPPSGIESIEADGKVTLFDLNGARVESLENAVPGIYVRVQNGKAQKVIVK